VRERFLVVGVVILTILYLWIVRASYAPAIVVGEGRNQCLTGNDCGSAWECLWPCGAGHLWGTDDPNGWECLWPCPECKETVYFQQDFEFTGCANEVGAPAASVDYVAGGGALSCDWTSQRTTGAHSQWKYCQNCSPNTAHYIHNYDTPDFSSSNPVYMMFDYWWTGAIYQVTDQPQVAITDGTGTPGTPTLRYPQLRYATGFLYAPKYVRVYCTNTAYVQVSGNQANRWLRVFVDINQATTTIQNVRIYVWYGGTWVPNVNSSCTSDQANAIDGVAIGALADGNFFGMTDNLRLSDCPFDEPGADPVAP